jgi:hypothetical protein
MSMIEDQDDVGAPAPGALKRPELLCTDDDAAMTADLEMSSVKLLYSRFTARANPLASLGGSGSVFAQIRTGRGRRPTWPLAW